MWDCRPVVRSWCWEQLNSQDYLLTLGGFGGTEEASGNSSRTMLFKPGSRNTVSPEEPASPEETATSLLCGPHRQQGKEAAQHQLVRVDSLHDEL